MVKVQHWKFETASHMVHDWRHNNGHVLTCSSLLLELPWEQQSARCDSHLSSAAAWPIHSLLISSARHAMIPLAGQPTSLLPVAIVHARIVDLVHSPLFTDIVGTWVCSPQRLYLISLYQLKVFIQTVPELLALCCCCCCCCCSSSCFSKKMTNGNEIL